MTWLEERIGLATARWVDHARRRAPWVLGLAVVITLSSLGLTARNLGVSTDTKAMLSPELPFRQARAELDAAFPILPHNFFIVIDAETPEQAREAATRLAAQLKRQPDRFSSVFVPGGGRFFEEHALLYLGLEELEELSDRLAAAQPLLAEFSTNPTLAGLAGALTRALDAARNARADDFGIEDALDGVRAAIDAALDERLQVFSWEEWVLGDALSSNGRRRVIIAQPVMQYEEFPPGRAALRTLHRSAKELELHPAHGVRLRITGSPALSIEELEVVSRQAAFAGMASFALVALLLFLALRSTYLVLSILVTLIVGLCWTAAFAALAIGHLNLMSVAFAVLFIGLGVDFGIHFSMRYREYTSSGTSQTEALRQSGRTVGSPLVLCAATTSLGFYAFVPTAYSGVAELGLISGTGMLICLFVTLTVLPAMLALGPVPEPHHNATGPGRALALTSRVLRRPRRVVIAAAFAGVGALLTLPGVRFDASPLSVRDPATESVKTMKELLANKRTVPWSIQILAAGFDEARDLAEKLERLPSVKRSVTLQDYVPRDQEEKLEALRDLAFLLGPSVRAPTSRNIDAEATRRALRRLHTSLELFEGSDVKATVAGSAHALREALNGMLQQIDSPSTTSEQLQLFERRILSDLPGLLRRLVTALEPSAVTLTDLPASLRERYVAPDGRVRVEVFPNVDLADSDGLKAFADSVRQVAPRATGPAVEIVESGRAIVSALWRALGLAAILISFLLFGLWRSLSNTALVMAPLAFAALLTTAASVVADLPFNFADVIVLPLLLGIGVDSAIHLVHRYRTAGPTSADLLRTSTARAVLFSALTTIGSFGTLGFATHRGMASLGQLLAIGVSFTLVANLLVLPSLLAWLRPERHR